MFVLPIAIISCMVFAGFGVFQVRTEQDKLTEDVKRKAKAVAESVDLSVKYILINNDLKSARQLVEKFQTRDLMQGCIIYDSSAHVIAATKRFSDWAENDNKYIKEALVKKVPNDGFGDFNQYSIYSYALPVLDDDLNALGAVEVVYDTSYISVALAQLWRRLSVTLMVLIALIFVIAVFIQRHIFILPVKKLTEWFQHFQKGDIDDKQPIREPGVLGNLASEVEEIALKMRIARKTMSKEAAVRVKEDELWTDSKLKTLVRAKLADGALFVVSNREPYMHVIDDVSGLAKCVRPASGVVTAIDPILRACSGTWVAQASGNADKKFVNSKNKLGVPPGDNRYILKRVWLTKEEEDGYYYGFSNEGLWPLCHMTHTRPIFRDSDWQTYKKVNQKFADAVLEELPASRPFIFIQDYHFTLLAKMIKEKRPDVIIALFWHIPWPNPEVFSICPYQHEILDGMLSCDLVGFHVQFHCNNFLDTANRLLECRVDTEKFSIVRSGMETHVRSFPISVDVSMAMSMVKAARPQKQRIIEEYDLKGKIIALGVERIDYTKGIIERVLAIDRFLEKNPEYKNKFVFIQLVAPSRTHIKRYHDLIAEIDELIEKKNWKYSNGAWKPIIYLKKQFSPEEIAPFYALADVCIVSSLHDGMNLVAKEFIASREDLGGSLILSSFTGASKELTDAIQINPYAIEEFADSIKLAVEMPQAEKRRRMENMRRVVSENNVYKWAASIITDLTALG